MDDYIDEETAIMNAQVEADWIQSQIDEAVAGWKARAEAAEAELAALRAQVDAQGWRPVEDAPDDEATVEAIVRLYYRIPYPLRDDEPTWNVEDLTDSYCIAPKDIRGWRPAPPKE